VCQSKGGVSDRLARDEKEVLGLGVVAAQQANVTGQQVFVFHEEQVLQREHLRAR
jgi:hypothetical protein